MKCGKMKGSKKDDEDVVMEGPEKLLYTRW